MSKATVGIIIVGVCCLILGHVLTKQFDGNSANEDSLNARLFLAKAKITAINDSLLAEKNLNDVLIREIGLRKKDIRKLKTKSHENIMRIDSASAGYLIGFFSRVDTARFLQ
jgi:hypothetical protein